MNTEFVYLFTNPCIPEWVKVGRTNSIPRRLSELDCTAVPIPFECYAYLEVPTDFVSTVESALHNFLGRALDKKKEFFHTRADVVLSYFQTIEKLNNAFHLVINPVFETKEEELKKQNTTFSMLDIPVGSVLTFTKDSTISCVVTDSNNQVSYNGLQYSISGLAGSLLGYNVNGFCKFIFEDETLWERRLRLHP